MLMWIPILLVFHRLGILEIYTNIIFIALAASVLYEAIYEI